MNISIEQIKLTSQFKKELKLEAAALQHFKQDIKNDQRDGECVGSLQNKLLKDKKSFRHRHIAYCMLRGKKYKQIEQKVRVGNAADMNLVNKIMEKYTYNEETVSAAA
ncbi:MAG: hypothetical protein DRP09_10190 [Candidatus Thorarchaeota archaeon]|nr:MAG: hypothetical protein DRP09_10190 [Candidatus Thorarchaeota archaeon]